MTLPGLGHKAWPRSGRRAGGERLPSAGLVGQPHREQGHSQAPVPEALLLSRPFQRKGAEDFNRTDPEVLRTRPHRS